MLKNGMTSFDISAVTHEINTSVEGAHISKIYQIGTQTLLLKLRKPSIPIIQLLCEARKRIHLTSYAHETPKKPSAFCMSLRKYLDNGIIKAVRQHEFERIAIIDISTRQGDFQLVVELFGGGNIILVDRENKILQAMTYKRMRDRNILRGETFQHPPTRGKNPLSTTLKEFMEIKNLGETETVRALTKILSISGTYAEEALLRANVDKKTKCAVLTEKELKSIFSQLQQLLSVIVSGKLEPSIVTDNENVWVDVTPIPLKKYNMFSQKKFKGFSVALDEYYTKIGDTKRNNEAIGDVKNEVARQQRIIQKQEKAIENLKKQIIENKSIGNLIYLHFGDLQSLNQKVLEKKRTGKSTEQIITILEEGKKAQKHPDVYFHSLDSANQFLYVSVENKKFHISIRDSIQASAENYYSRSKKAQRKLIGAEKRLLETRTKIMDAKNQVTIAKANQQSLTKRKKKEWFEKFRWFRSSDDLLVIGGRDATTNEILIKKHMEPKDIIFHAEIVGAPFVLIKTDGKTASEQTLSEAAQLAASYSRAWREMLSAINVYWVTPEQVSKTPLSGQFLPKGSFMIRGSKNFIRGVPLHIAIGVKIGDEGLAVIGGPVEAIASQADKFVEVVPGYQKSGQIAKQIRYQLSTKVSEDLKRCITAIPLEEFQHFIPLGRGKIIETRVDQKKAFS